MCHAFWTRCAGLRCAGEPDPVSELGRLLPAAPPRPPAGHDDPMTHRSEALFDRALRLMPGGVSSPVRAFGAVGGSPLFIAEAAGARLTDVDGRSYIDLVGSWGPMILGHAHPAVTRAITQAAQRGSSFGAPTEAELDLAERVLQRVPSVDRLRFVNSGTEACMSALRLARAATGRDLILKFAGHYHGHADGLLVAAGSGAMTTGVPSSAGVPASTAAMTLVAEFNDAVGLARLFAEQGQRIAAAIVEPVAGNMGVVAPEEGFLEGLQQLCRTHGALLVVDEVMTGFRLARGGAVERYGLQPDLVTWGKVIGGGLPVGAYGGRAELMDMISPKGPVYQAGTLSGNPLAMAAGIATLDAIDALPDLYPALEAEGARLAACLRTAAQQAGTPVTVNQVGSMLTVFFQPGPVTDHRGASGSDTTRFARFFHALLHRGVYWPPSQFEAAFLNHAIGEEEMNAILEAATGAMLEAAQA